MCGICGFIDFNFRSSDEILKKMVATLRHRGPDDSGSAIYNYKNASVGLGQARLSILDLSPAGHQPMNFNQYSIVLNGEIYNFREIQDELIKTGHRFISESDTEVVLHSFDEWGTECVNRFIGMFAFVILDRVEGKVYFFRDRAGVKPLYYYIYSNIILFASELKAFCSHPSFEKKLDPQAAGYFFKMGYVPSPFAIYQNTKKLDPGCFATYDLSSRDLTIKKYWDVNEFYRRPKTKISYEEAKSELRKLLVSACNYRMVSDVPVGVFLSGGYDSSAITAILQKDRTERIKTFTIGFEEGNNEAPYARKNAEFLGTDHTEYICKSREAQDMIPQLSYFYDEPFADSSAIPTMLVSKTARSTVTVALSADGGDELFCGYNSHIEYRRLFNRIKTIQSMGSKVSSPVLKGLLKFIPKKYGLYSRIEFLESLLNSPAHSQNSLLREGMLSVYKNVYELTIRGIPYPENIFTGNYSDFPDPLSVALAVDYSCYLQNDILTKVDRATMSVSLEGREPLIDHRLVEFAAGLPIEYKYDGLQTKKIFRDIVHEYIPRNMMDRPKTGFTLPISEWLRGDLHYLMQEYLNSAELERTGIFNTRFVIDCVSQFMKGKLHDESLIWKLLQFQMWYQRWMK